MELLSEQNPKARKDHKCMASEFIRDALNENIFSFSEYREIVKMKKNNWKIKKGEKYLRQNILDDGGIYTFSASLEMDYLCREYDLYV